MSKLLAAMSEILSS